MSVWSLVNADGGVQHHGSRLLQKTTVEILPDQALPRVEKVLLPITLLLNLETLTLWS